MGILGCVAVAGKMLAASKHATASQPLDNPPARRRNLIGVGAKGAIADDRVAGIGKNVQHRSEVEIDPDRGKLSRCCQTHLVSKVPAARASDRGGGRQVRERFGQAMHAAALLIDGDERGKIRVPALPERAAEEIYLLRIMQVMRKKNDAAGVAGG